MAAVGLSRCVIPLHHCLLSMYDQSIHNSVSLGFVVYAARKQLSFASWCMCRYATQLRFVSVSAAYIQLGYASNVYI